MLLVRTPLTVLRYNLQTRMDMIMCGHHASTRETDQANQEFKVSLSCVVSCMTRAAAVIYALKLIHPSPKMVGKHFCVLPKSSWCRLAVTPYSDAQLRLVSELCLACTSLSVGIKGVGCAVFCIRRNSLVCVTPFLFVNIEFGPPTCQL